MQGSVQYSSGTTYTALGQVAVQHGLITENQLGEALAHIREEHMAGKKTSLEDHLLETGLIDKETMGKLIATTIRKLDKQFGAIAVSKELTTQDKVDNALEIQKHQYKQNKLVLICDILLENGSITEEQRDYILTELNGVLAPPDEKSREIPDSSHEPDHSKDQLDEKLPPEDKPEKIELATPIPHLKAELIIPESLCESTDLAKIKQVIADHGVKHGVVDDSVIENMLSTEKNGEVKFPIAEGTPPKPSKDAEIKLYFEKDYLNPGKITEDGTIDFRDRGSVPFVKKGDLLAEKIPAVEGVPGMDIYGDPIPIEPPNDKSLLSGSGAEAASGGLKIFATIEGQPIISVHGEVSVFTELNIPGDVDYNTGNINFDGNIIVKGTVKEGFIVKGGSLTAREIIGAKIDVVGNVDVSGGVIDSEISAGGCIQAMYMSDSKTDSYGDVKIKKEIIDCSIFTSGACSGERTKIISSSISARQGIEASQIGTDVSKPCVLKVGVNDHTENKVVKIQKNLKQKMETLTELQKKMEDQKQCQADIHKKIADLYTKLDATVTKNEGLKKLFEEHKNKDGLSEGDKKNLALIESAMDDLNSLQNQLKEEASTNFKEQDELTSQILKLHSGCDKLVDEIEKLNSNIREIRSWAKKNKSVPSVKTLKDICAKTSITGPNTTLILETNVKNSCIKESERTEKGYSGWEMTITPNKK